MSAQGALPDGRDDFGLIETLLWTREGGCWLVAGHRARMAEFGGGSGLCLCARGF